MQSSWNVWGVSASWNYFKRKLQEKKTKYIDNIKFRVGYGETGNQQIENNTYCFIRSTKLWIDLVLPNNFPNPDLKRESLNQTNLGF
jgi:hypothetical protein